MIERHCEKSSSTWPSGRADKAPNLSLSVSKATWEDEEPESDEGEDGDQWKVQVEDIIKEVWNQKWKTQARRIIQEHQMSNGCGS